MELFTDRQRYTGIPFFLRKAVLRLLLASTTASIASNAVFLVSLINQSPQTEALSSLNYLILALLIAAHHTLRLWPWRYWLVVCEVLLSFGEVAAVCIISIPQCIVHLKVSKDQLLVYDPLLATEVISSILMSFSVSVACFFLLCDITCDRGKNILRPYGFSVGPYEAPRLWSFIWGTYTVMKRFTTDNIFLQYIRGWTAILGFLLTSYLALYLVIWKPLQWNRRIGANIYKMPVPNGGLSDALNSLGAEMSIWTFLRAPPNWPSHLYPNVTIGLHPNPANIAYDNCTSGVYHSLVSTAFCGISTLKLPDGDDEILDVLITIHFPDTPGDFRLFLGLGDTPDESVSARLKATGISPGSNFHGWGTIRITHFPHRYGVDSATNTISVIEVDGLSPDLSPSLPRDNSTATLRTTITSQWFIEIEQEYFGVSVLDGVAVVGGVWVFVNGTFAAVFGSTLLHVLFGIKPLSVYGLAQSFRRGNRSLVEAKRTLSPEERDRIVSLLREHLLDADTIEGDEASSSKYDSVDVLPRSRHSGSGD